MCANGEILFQNIAWYRPKPLLMRHGWVSPQSICFRDLEQEELRPGRELGYAVLEALGFRTGFAHMEWFPYARRRGGLRRDRRAPAGRAGSSTR